jgi:hypothetical protein
MCPDGNRLVSAGADRTVIFRKVGNGGRDVETYAKPVVKRTVHDLALHPTNKYLVRRNVVCVCVCVCAVYVCVC